MITFGDSVSNLILQKTLLNATEGLNFCIKNMTTGYKVNHAKDNAAGHSIIEDLSKKISSMLQVQQNNEQGIDLLSTAEGGLTQVQELLERLRALAIQASNDTYDAQSRAAIQEEADAIIEQISQIKESMNYNGMNLYEIVSDTANPVIRLAKSAKVLTTGDTGIKTIDTNTFALTGGEDKGSNTESSPSVSLFSTNTTNTVTSNSKMKTMSAANEVQGGEDYGIMPAAEGGTTIDGTESFTAGQTKTIIIDEVSYTIKNNLSTNNEISYSKNMTTGEITFTGNNFVISGQTNVQHKLIIDGDSNTVYGGDLDDSISTARETNRSNVIYGGTGNDYLYTLQIGGGLYGQAGEDTLIAASYTSILGGSENDTIEIVSRSDGTGNYCNVYGGVGNDTITVQSGSNHVINGEDGNDIITLVSGTNNIINGGSGTNTYNGSFADNTIINVVGAPDFGEDFTAGQNRNILINGINYSITNNKSSAQTFIYSIDSATGQIIFSSSNFTIIGETSKEHNIQIKGNDINFTGGNYKDKIVLYGERHKINALEGDNEISVYAPNTIVLAGDGNNTIKEGCANFGTYISLGDGNNNVTLNYKNNIVHAGSGTNTITDYSSNNLYSGFGSKDNCSSVLINGASSQTVVINEKSYTVQNSLANDMYLLYQYNSATEQVTLGSSHLTITAQSNVEHNVKLIQQYTTFYGGNQNDIIEAYGSTAYIYSENGDDIISNMNGYVYGGAGNDILKSSSGSKGRQDYYGGDGDDTFEITKDINAYGEAGNDIYKIDYTSKIADTGGNNIYYVNANNTTITGGDGNDTFYITGTGNTVNGGAGNDYFVIDGDNTTINGGSGANYYQDNAVGSNITFADVDPNGGVLSFTSLNEVKTITINEKIYTITNNLSSANSLVYAFNENTGIISFEGSDFIIDSEENKSALLSVRGNNNTINGSNQADNIEILQGSNNTINGLNGNDTLTLNTENNSAIGGDGNDTININATTTMDILGGIGDDTFNVNSANNTKLDAGDGNNKINLNGSNNTIKANDGNNTVRANSGTNTINLGNGDNNVTLLSDNNIVISGNGLNNFALQGNSNRLTAQNSANNITITGNSNEFTTAKGADNLTINGNNNIYTSTIGNKNIKINGNENSITTGNQDDKFNIVGNSNNIETLGGTNNTTVKGNSNTYIGGSGSDIVKITGDSNNISGGDGNDKVSVSGGNLNTFDGEGGDNTILDNGVNTNYSNARLITFEPFELNLKIDIGSGEDKFIRTSIGFSLLDFNIDLTSRNSALASIEQIDNMLKTVEEQLVNIGATINRLEYIAQAQAIKLDNLISTRSTLRDADIAEVSSEYIRYQILQQANSTLMAHTRQLRYENVIGLLQGLNK